MARLVSGIKSVLGIGGDSSQGQTDEDSGDGQPLALQASKVSADLKKVVGVGSQGTVYTGKFMGDKCAVKVFNRGVIQRDVVHNHDIASIIQHHPNVVLVHGLWYGNQAIRLPSNDPALVMELCMISLDAYIKERVDRGEVAVFRLEKRLEILSGVTSGMIYLHNKRIIHGDLSAKKVLLSFGGPSNDKTILAKVAGVCQMKLFTQDIVLRHQTSVQRSGIMPPEVKDAGEDVELTEAVDVFSFGCLIAHVASCIYPVPNTKAGLNEFQKRAQFITGNHQAHIYEPLMKRCLDKHPVARGTFEDVKKDLSVHQSKYGGKQAQKLEDQIREMENRKGEILALEREADQLKKQVESLQKANNELQSRKTALERELDDVNTEQLQLKQEKQVLENEVKNAREESLQSCLQEVKTTQASFGDLFGKYEEAKSEVSRLQKEVAQYKKDMEDKDAEVVRAVEQHTESVAKHGQLWQENITLQQALAEVKCELGDCQKSLDGVQRTNRALALEKQNAIQRCGQLQTDLQKLQKEKEAKDKALAENDKKLKALNGTVRDLSSKDTTSGGTINMLRREVETLKQQLSRTQAEKRQADGDLVSVRKECRQTKESLEDCQEKLGKEMKSSKILQKQLEEKEKKLAALDGKLGDKEEELIQLHADRQKKERKVDDQATAIQSLELKLKQLQEQVDQWQKQCHSVSAELEEAKAAKGLLEESKSKLEDEKSACENRIQRLQGRLEGKEEDMNKKQKEYNQLLTQYHDVKTQFDEGKEQLPGMEQQIEDLEKEKRELETEQKILTTQRDTSRRKVTELSEKVGRLEADLEKKKDAITGFEMEVQQNHGRISTLEGHLKGATEAKQNREKLLEEESSRALKAERSLKAQEEESKKLLQEKRDLESERKTLLEDLEKRTKEQGELHSANKSLEGTVADLHQELQREKRHKQKWLGAVERGEKEQGELYSANILLEGTVAELDQELQRAKALLEAKTEANIAQKQKLQEVEATLSARMKDYDDSEIAQMDLRVQLVEAKEAASALESWKKEAVEAKQELVTIKTDNTVLMNALECKRSKELYLEEEIRRLKASQIDQHKIRREKQMLHTEKAELHRERQELRTELAKLQAKQEQVQKQYEHLVHSSAQEKEKLLQTLTQLHDSSARLETTVSSVGYGSEHRDQLEGRILEVERSLQNLSDTTEQFGATLEKDRSDSHAMMVRMQGVDTKKRNQFRFRTATECTREEALLQQLCYMATGIKELIIGPDGGTFTLGSGDAKLEFPPGVVAEETSVRYAIILHGPFVFPAGYKPGSVVVYLNMESATLKNPPVLLYLSYWSIKKREDDQDTLKFLRASHTLEEGQQEYVFEEQEAKKTDFTTHTHVGVLKIWEPKCLYCVEAKGKEVARYNAITFSQYIPSEQTLLFRIQLMCDSLEWNERMTTTLMQGNWEKTSTVVPQFQYSADHQKITACPQEVTGPGWEAVIDGTQEIMQHSFLAPLGKSKDEIEREVISGRFPPCILYKIMYRSPEERRTRRALLKVKLNGADVSLFFSCSIKEEIPPPPPVPFHSCERNFGDDTFPIIGTDTVETSDILTALDHRLDAKWRLFGTFLRVEHHILEAIQRDKGGNPEDCMLDLLSKWTSNQAAGMGTLLRTWQTVVDAVHKCGDRDLAQSVARKHGGQLPH